VNTRNQAAELLKVLSHPARLRILAILRGGEECVCHMEAALRVRQAYLSQQLSVLRDAGLVRVRREGWNIYYSVIRPEVFEVIDAAAGMTSEKDGTRAARGGQRLRVRDCACPKCAVTRTPDAD
jgi:DNA-binding transcriptional ArsR family regulator